MKLLTQNYRSGLLALRDVPPPQLQPDGVMVQTAFSLISAGTERSMIDLAQRNLFEKARARPDLVRKVMTKAQTEGVLTAYQKALQRLETEVPLGYSSAGLIIAAGERIDDLTVGMPVACAGGGYASHAEIVYVPRNLCAPVPIGVNLRQAAFTTLGAIALQGVRTAAPGIGDVVTVIGLGLVGLLTVQILKATGCQVVGFDPNETRGHLARELGANMVVSQPSELTAATEHLSGGLGADAVIVTAASTSSEPLELAGEVARDRARIVIVGQVGMTIPRKLYYEKELSVVMSRSYGPGRYDRLYEEKGIDYPAGYVRWTENRNLGAFLDLLAQHKLTIDPLITHEFAFDDALKAYDLVLGHQPEPHIGVLLKYPQGDQPLSSATVRVMDQGQLTGATRRPTHDSSRQPTEVVLGVLGVGSFATGTLLPALRQVPSVRFQAICSQTGLSARSAADRLGFAYCTSDTAEVINDPAINAVIIATRPDSHATLATAALAAGKHVFVEKPLAVTPEQLPQLITAMTESVERSGHSPILMVGFNRRFSPHAVKVKEFLQRTGGPFIVTYRVNASYLATTDWQHDSEQGGGRLIGEVGHFIDLLMYLTGSQPTEVSAQALKVSGTQFWAQENTALTVRFADGSLGVVTYLTNGADRFGKERVEVFGNGATAVIDDFRQVELLRGSRRRSSRDWLSQEKGHQAELTAFIDAIRSGGPAPVFFEDYLLTTLCTFQAVESLRTGQSEAIHPPNLPATLSHGFSTTPLSPVGSESS